MNNIKLLDLGCGKKKRHNAIGVDIIKNPQVDIVHDLNIYPYPFPDQEFDDILMDNALEHLDNINTTLEELYRISKENALVTIKVPYFRSHTSVDPTHRHSFAYHSFFYYDPTHPFNEMYRYSNNAFFKVEKVIYDEQYGFYPGILQKLVFNLPKLIANSFPQYYEEYLAHIVPLHCLTFKLRTVKSPDLH